MAVLAKVRIRHIYTRRFGYSNNGTFLRGMSIFMSVPTGL